MRPPTLESAQRGTASSIAQLRAGLRGLGCLPVHEERVLRVWTQALGWNERGRAAEDFLPQRVRGGLPAIEDELQGLARVHTSHPGSDGSTRLLVELAHGGTVEAVLLPRGGLCVSSQIGCAVGCVFCSTGLGGLSRQLASTEIVAQVVLARTLRPVKKVVFMGMGEPAHNLEAVLEAIDLLGTAGGIGHKNLVFSTVGDERAFERLAASRVQPALALSLHAADPEMRARLLPRAPRIAPEALVAHAERYARLSGYPVQVQWTLLAGINDGDDEIDHAARLLAGKHAVLNLIDFNPGPGLDFDRTAPERSTAILRRLQAQGVLAKLRRSAGQDVDAGCGQLRARNADGGEQRIDTTALGSAAATSRSGRCSPAAT